MVLPEELDKYLAAAPQPLRDVATVLSETGLRPEECFRMRWEDVRFIDAKRALILVQHGKSAAARRPVPMTPRVRAILSSRWQAAEQPGNGWVWPAPKASAGHIVPNSIYEPHRQAIKDSGVRPFVLYSLRHTFLTRLGASGIDAWSLARIAGHSSLQVSANYVHPSDTALHAAIGRLVRSGYKSGYSKVRAIKPKLLKPAK